MKPDPVTIETTSEQVARFKRRSAQDSGKVPGLLREDIEKLLEKSKNLANNSPKEALEAAKLAYDGALNIADVHLQIQSALALIARYGRLSRTIDRDLLIEEWKDKIRRDGTIDQQAGFSNVLAVIQLEKSDHGAALRILREAAANFDQMSEPSTKTLIKINLANSYSGLSMNEKAVDLFYEALEECLKSGDKSLRCHVHNNLGILHRMLLDLDPAIKQFEEVLSLSEELNNIQMRAHALNNLCGAYFYKGDLDKAEEFSRQAYDINRKIENRYGVQAALNNFGKIYHQRGEYDRALASFEEALPIATALENNHAIAVLLKNVADTRLARKEYDQVIPLYNKAKALAEKVSDQAMLYDLYGAYVRFFEDCEDWERTVQYMRLLMEVRELLFTSKQREAVEQHRLRFETEQKEREATLLQEKNLALEQEIAERKMVEAELKDAISRIKILTGLLPICSHCKKIRDKEGEWHQVEYYISKRTDAQFSHGVCPDCRKEYYKQG